MDKFEVPVYPFYIYLPVTRNSRTCFLSQKDDPLYEEYEIKYRHDLLDDKVVGVKPIVRYEPGQRFVDDKMRYYVLCKLIGSRFVLIREDNYESYCRSYKFDDDGGKEYLSYDDMEKVTAGGMKYLKPVDNKFVFHHSPLIGDSESGVV